MRHVIFRVFLGNPAGKYSQGSNDPGDDDYAVSLTLNCHDLLLKAGIVYITKSGASNIVFLSLILDHISKSYRKTSCMLAYFGKTPFKNSRVIRTKRRIAVPARELEACRAIKLAMVLVARGPCGWGFVDQMAD